MNESGAPRTSPVRILLSAQFLASGNGGICTVARMTAMGLSDRYAMTGVACQDVQDHEIGNMHVRAFNDERLRFVLGNAVACARSTHVIYDFAGTARAHVPVPFRRRPYAVWVHGWEIWNDPPKKYLRAIAGASLVLANSNYTVERAGSALPAGLDVRPCLLGTPEDDAPATIGPPDGPPTVMLLGRSDELFAKGQDILIRVWPRVRSAIPDARLVFVGGGNALGRVRALADASPVRDAIEIAGFVPDDRIDAYWRRATVFALLGFAEGFGLVYIDAMRRGLPVVASTDDGGQEVNVDGVTGFNVARSDEHRLVDVLVALLSDRDRARAMGAQGHMRWRQEYAFSAFRNRLTAATKGLLSA